MKEYREALRLDPGANRTRVNLGNALLQQRKVDEGTAEFRELVGREPKSDVARINLARALAMQGSNWGEAASNLREALRLDPRSTLARGLLGIVLRAQGKPDEALAEFREILAAQPNNGAVHYQVAVTMFSTQKYEDAWQAVQRARTSGFTVPEEFLRALAQKLPEPKLTR